MKKSVYKYKSKAGYYINVKSANGAWHSKPVDLDFHTPLPLDINIDRKGREYFVAEVQETWRDNMPSYKINFIYHNNEEDM